MTRDQIAAGLSLLVLHLANDQDFVPPGWTPHEWAYLKGLASGRILELRDRLSRGTSDIVGPVGLSDRVGP